MWSVPAQNFNTTGVLPGPQPGCAPTPSPITVTVSGNSGILALNQGLDFGAVLAVTQTLGTLPTLNVKLQQSMDDGMTWQDVWHFEQMTANGSSYMPALKLQGVQQIVWTVGGTTPSFTFQVYETGSAQPGLSAYRRFFDYTTALLAGTLNASSAAYRCDGSTTVSATVTLGAGGTPGTYALQFSADGVDWYQPGTPVVAVANGTIVVTQTNVAAPYTRVVVTSAGTGQTGTVVSITTR